ncbi:MAG TPA: AEC family transporter [Nitrococcus sp.]|nr:AEC family transporter [Nitrococcus sp.]
MVAVINIALPFFALIFTGYGAGRSGLLSVAAVVGLNAFVFYFALPALLLVKVSQAPMASADTTMALIGTYYSAGLLLFAATFMLGRWLFRASGAVGALQGLGATFSNVGFVGLPLVISAYGDEAALPAMLIVIGDSLFMLGLATAIIEADRGTAGRSGLALLSTIAGGLLRNPIIVASLAGIALHLGTLALPAPLLAYMSLLAAAAGPCALFALGATLAGQPIREGAVETGFLSLMKLAVHPLLVSGAALLVFHLPPLWAAVAITQASLPIGANVYVLAQRYQVHARSISTAVLVSTTLAVLTVSVVLSWLYPVG